MVTKPEHGQHDTQLMWLMTHTSYSLDWSYDSGYASTMLCIQYKNPYNDLVEMLFLLIQKFERHEKGLHSHHFQRIVLRLLYWFIVLLNILNVLLIKSPIQ